MKKTMGKELKKSNRIKENNLEVTSLGYKAVVLMFIYEPLEKKSLI